MSVVLGIDTGGTFTDAVIIDLETKKIYSETKSETTHFHLIEGISKAIDQLEYDDFSNVAYASLSTTLATNAIVEGRGCRVGLIVMGFAPKELPRCELAVIPGAIDLHGGVAEPLDSEKTRAAIESFRGKVDAVAVSCILSIRNPSLENEVKTMVREQLGLPCVAAHELSSALGMQERTVTAALNARLLSVIDDLFAAVKEALAKKGMDIPIMIVKGDGSLMTEATAKYRPIETILSGSAASIIGATFFNGTDHGLILDMGGTTTDIAVMKNGRPRIDPQGASVGGWRTRVAAAEVNTFGLGGDSRIHLDMVDHKVKVGPRRVYPLSTICRLYPHYRREMHTLVSQRIGLMKYELCEGFFLLRELPVGMLSLSNTQYAVLRELKDGPHTIRELSSRIGVDPDFIHMDLLVEHGIVALVGFTPTDLLHAVGEYTRGDAEGSKLGLTLLARRWDMTEEDVAATIRKKITESLAETILDSAFAYEKLPLDAASTEQLKAMVKKAFYEDKEDLLSILFHLNMPVVGIGAPIRSWLTPAAEKFHTDVIYPEHYHVANAVGAAAGKITHIYRITVQNHEIDGIHVYAPWGRTVFGVDEEEEHGAEDVTAEQMHIGNQRKTRDFVVNQAIQYAISEGKRRMEAELKAENLENYEILVERHDRTVGYTYNENIQMFIESQIEIIAAINPNWQYEN